MFHTIEDKMLCDKMLLVFSFGILGLFTFFIFDIIALHAKAQCQMAAPQKDFENIHYTNHNNQQYLIFNL